MKVTVLMGGDGNERAISLKTGGAMANALEGAGYTVERFDFRRARLGEFVAMPHDVVLFAMHGRDGEDGVMQAVCELLDAPYTGSGVQASALAIDKVRSKQMFVAAGVATPESAVATRADAECPVPLPAVVKPSKDGSSVGVALVREPAEWAAARDRAADGDGVVLVERFIAGRELSVGVRDGALLGVVEIHTSSAFFDHEAKYESEETTVTLPAQLTEETTRAVEAAALGAYAALGCRGVARVDVMLDEAERPYVLEVNTTPGMTASSLVPKMAAALGESFASFVAGLVGSATTDAAVDAQDEGAA